MKKVPLYVAKCYLAFSHARDSRTSHGGGGQGVTSFLREAGGPGGNTQQQAKRS